MKKKIKPFGEHLPPVKLFLTDLTKLYEIFYSVNNEVQIETENHIIESIDELSTIDEDKLNNISFKITNPYISIEFRKSLIWLYASSDDYTSKGIINELKKYLKSKRRRLHYFIESPPIAGGIIGLLLMANLIYIKSVILGLLATIALLLSIGYTNWVLKRNFEWYTIIYLSKNANDLNFFQRKKDEIILVVISSILGAILGSIGTYLITQ